MVNCSHCKKELKRNVFCSGSCKVMFHRRTPKKKRGTLTNKKLKKLINKVSDIDQFPEEVILTDPLCKHGFMPSLCKDRKCRST